MRQYRRVEVEAALKVDQPSEGDPRQSRRVQVEAAIKVETARKVESDQRKEV